MRNVSACPATSLQAMASAPACPVAACTTTPGRQLEVAIANNEHKARDALATHRIVPSISLPMINPSHSSKDS